MTHHTQLEDKLGDVNKFRAWKYRIFVILEENDLNHYITNEVPEAKGDEAKANHKNNLVKSKIIIQDTKISI